MKRILLIGLLSLIATVAHAAKLEIAQDSTSVTLNVFIQDSSVATGAGKTGLTANTASFTCYYGRPGAADVATSLTTLASVTAAYKVGGFIATDATHAPGKYRFDAPNAAFASGASSVMFVFNGASNQAEYVQEFAITNYASTSDITTALLAGIVDGSIDVKTGFKRLLAAVFNNATISGSDITLKDSAGSATVGTQNISAGGRTTSTP